MSNLAWRAKGSIFENCNCQLVCPGHIHFDQLCTHERCLGYWAVRIDHGQFEDVSLDGGRVVIAFDTPQRMIEGNWTQILLIDESAAPAQRVALEKIFTGKAGGPWEKLSGFVGRWQETRYLPIGFTEEEGVKSVSIPNLPRSVVTRIRGRDRGKPVLLENMYNQIHAATQVLALGTTEYSDGTIRIGTSKSHGLFSSFDWRVEAAAPTETAI